MALSDLARRIRAGDKTALRELVEQYGDSVYRKAFERTQDASLAREATRKTFLQLVTTLREHADADGWELWFGAVARRSIDTYGQLREDMAVIESELENELYASSPQRILADAARPEHGVDAPPFRTFRRTDASSEAEPPLERRSGSEQPFRPVTGRRAGAHPADERIFPTEDRRSRRGVSKVALIVLLVLLLLLLWVTAGIGMTAGWIPFFDLGYTWFDINVYPLF